MNYTQRPQKLLNDHKVSTEEIAVRSRAEGGGKYRGIHRAMGKYAGYLYALAIIGVMSLIATPLRAYLDLANIVLLFLLVVMVTAVKFGRGPAVMASFAIVAACDFFFIQPRFSFSVADAQYVVTFVVMLVVGLVTSHLAAGLRHQASLATQREARFRALYEFARELSGALQFEQVCDGTRKAMQQTFNAQALLLVPGENGKLRFPPFPNSENLDLLRLSSFDMGAAQWAFHQTTQSGAGTATFPDSAYSFFPLVAPMRARGVLAIYCAGGQVALVDQSDQLKAFAAVTAIALERIHYVDVAQEALVRVESERLRNSLLAALSHDLRTPLTSLVGLSESLAMSRPYISDLQTELAGALRDEALKMCRSVDNLLEMARIQAGNVTLNVQWQSFEEVVGSTLRTCRPSLANHEVRTRIEPNLPLVRFDAMLIERVLSNLVENASKYTLPGSRITVSARSHGEFLEAQVCDNGPGLPQGAEETVFEKFVRGNPESALPGVGLGLSICRAIVEAHKGSIKAATPAEGGACFTFLLPLGTPPAAPDVDEDELREPYLP